MATTTAVENPAVEKRLEEPKGLEVPDTPWGLYQVDDAARWSMFSPERGMVVVFNLPRDFLIETGEEVAENGEEVEMALVITERRVMDDGSYLLTGKSLGVSDGRFNSRMSSMFNRKVSYVHVCPGVFDCQHAEAGVFHVTTLWLYSHSSFHRAYVGTGGKRILKSALAEITGEEVEEVPEEGGTRGKKKAATGKGRGGDPKRTKDKEGEDGQDAKGREDKAKELRQRLKEIQARKEGGPPGKDPSDGGDVSSEDGSEEDSGSGSWEKPVMNQGNKLPALAIADGTVAQGGAQGHRTTGGGAPQADGGGGPPKKKKQKTPTTVGGQLALNAARAQQGDQDQGDDPAGGGGGGAGPLAFLKKAKKKKIKKKKKAAKKKKKKSKKGRGGGGPSSSGGSSKGSSSSSSSSSTDERNYLPPLRRKSQKKPGSVLQLLLDQIQEHMDAIGEDSVRSGGLGGTKVLAYYNNLVRTGVVPTSRDGREMYLLAMVIDHLRMGQLDRVADSLSARFLALHQAHLDGGWSAARNLEIYCPEVLSAAGSEVTLRARKLEKVGGKPQTSWTQWGRGGQPAWNKGGSWYHEDKGDSKGKYKKGKSKGKQDPWYKGKTKGGGGAPQDSAATKPDDKGQGHDK